MEWNGMEWNGIGEEENWNWAYEIQCCLKFYFLFFII